MSEPEQKRHIVRPFGLIGGDYEIDDAGRRKYNVAITLTTLGLGTSLVNAWRDLSPWWVLTPLAVVLIPVLLLCRDVVRHGRKL